MTLYYNVWLCVTLDDPLFHCMTMFDSGRLNWTLYDSPWPCMSLYHPLWLWMILNYSFGISFINIDCVFIFFLVVLFLSTVWTCLKCLTRSESVQLMQLWTNFGLVSWTCLGWFRMVQNGSNGLKRLKKSSLFSNCA